MDGVSEKDLLEKVFLEKKNIGMTSSYLGKGRSELVCGQGRTSMNREQKIPLGQNEVDRYRSQWEL